MKVRDLIEFLEKVENKEQNISVVSYDFDTVADARHIIEIKTVDNKDEYPVGVCIIADL